MARKTTYHHRESRINRVIVLEDMNFFWDECELEEIVKMCNQGVSIHQMGDHFNRDPDEVLLAFIHLAREDRIDKEVHQFELC